jgi:hypothetical protein
VKRYEKWSFRAGKPMNTIWKLDKNGALELRFFFLSSCYWVSLGIWGEILDGCCVPFIFAMERDMY